MSVYNSVNLDLGRDGALSPFIHHATAGRRKRYNVCRKWNALSRLQRSLFGILFLLFMLTLSFYALAYFESEQDRFTKMFMKKIKKPGVVQVRLEPEISKGPFGPKNDRQLAVVRAFEHAWSGYSTYAWGHDHLKPLSKSFHDWFGLGLSIVDSLDTMIVMGLNEQFNKSRNWVANRLTFDTGSDVNFFETTIRVLGGLLSAYHLTKDRMFLDKAKDLGDRLSGAFDNKYKIPYPDVSLETKQPRLPSWTGDCSLSEVATVQLEFRDLSRVTNDQFYEELAFNVSQRIHDLGCSDGLCPMFIDPKTGNWRKGTVITMGARADSYYEYLLKQWLQTGKTVDWLKNDYLLAMHGMERKLLNYSRPNKFYFVGELLNGNEFSPKMDHLVCFIAGTLALGALHKLPRYRTHLDIAQRLGRTCYEMYNNPTGLGPEIAHFNMVPVNKEGASNDLFVKSADSHSLLRPEAIEAWFYLYRVTGQRHYQEWGWNAFQAIERHARVKHGYASVNNVKRTPVSHKDMMESFFLAETLKYLFLLFDDYNHVEQRKSGKSSDNVLLPLDKWVFNTEGHPLPIYDQ